MLQPQGSEDRSLFEEAGSRFAIPKGTDARTTAFDYESTGPAHLTPLPPHIGDDFTELYEVAENPDNPLELRDLYLGRVEASLAQGAYHRCFAHLWRNRRRKRSVSPTEVLTSRTTCSFIKHLFNWYFQQDLYGRLWPSAHTILSSGSASEDTYGLARPLKACIEYALARNWYGYSDSLGRLASREAVAQLESSYTTGHNYDVSQVALTLGGTSAISSVVDFVALQNHNRSAPALCAVPNYPPLVQAVANRADVWDVELVPIAAGPGEGVLDPIITRLRPDTPLVLLQTVANTTGTRIDEAEIIRLVEHAASTTTIILDECHECLGRQVEVSRARSAANVVRVKSLSKLLSAPGLKVGWILSSADFIRDFYEFASTRYGSPASLFYLFVEVFARMERWNSEGRISIGAKELREFESSYDLHPKNLQQAYLGYQRHRSKRISDVITTRERVMQQFQMARLPVLSSTHSVNVSVELSHWSNGYLAFRDTLQATGVSVFPGILGFWFSGSLVRLSPIIEDQALKAALSQLTDFWSNGP